MLPIETRPSKRSTLCADSWAKAWEADHYSHTTRTSSVLSLHVNEPQLDSENPLQTSEDAADTYGLTCRRWRRGTTDKGDSLLRPYWKDTGVQYLREFV